MFTLLQCPIQKCKNELRKYGFLSAEYQESLQSAAPFSYLFPDLHIYRIIRRYSKCFHDLLMMLLIKWGGFVFISKCPRSLISVLPLLAYFQLGNFPSGVSLKSDGLSPSTEFLCQGQGRFSPLSHVNRKAQNRETREGYFFFWFRF